MPDLAGGGAELLQKILEDETITPSLRKDLRLLQDKLSALTAESEGAFLELSQARQRIQAYETSVDYLDTISDITNLVHSKK